MSVRISFLPHWEIEAVLNEQPFLFNYFEVVVPTHVGMSVRISFAALMRKSSTLLKKAAF
jgi:hypothetical protein